MKSVGYLKKLIELLPDEILKLFRAKTDANQSKHYI